jgi:hypothetical protein
MSNHYPRKNACLLKGDLRHLRSKYADARQTKTEHEYKGDFCAISSVFPYFSAYGANALGNFKWSIHSGCWRACA